MQGSVRVHPGAAARCAGPLRRARAPRRCAAAPRAAAAAAAAAPSLSVTLKRPLGIIFAEREKGAAAGVYVEELVPGGNAARAGVQVGDVLLRCSATVLKDGKEGQFEAEGYGQRPYTNWDRIMFDAAAQDFDTARSGAASAAHRGAVALTLASDARRAARRAASR
jgi:hypothetical protein